jgi:hypothetical protein
VVTTRVRIDRIASSTHNAKLGHDMLLGPEIACREGYVIAVRILTDKTVYNEVEDPSGRFIRLRAGDTLAGTLGHRRALRGYAGEVPESLAVGDVVQVLNMGGVLGRCTAINPDLGKPFDAEVLGAVLVFPRVGDRVGRPAHISENAVQPADVLECRVPVVYVAGTCMNAGKTMAAAEIVHGLARAGMRVAATKLTGVALMRDALAMVDAGAVAALTFNDAGVVSTSEAAALPTARGLLNELARAHKPDVIVAELGDGVLGEYGVAAILADRALMSLSRALVACAPDQVASWGIVRVLDERFGLRPAVISGPATDNDVGCKFIREELGLPAHNARRGDGALARVVLEALRAS